MTAFVIHVVKTHRADPDKVPFEDPRPYKDPLEPPPGDPQEDRPMYDPIQPDADRPRS
jgi:hypothetical protein